MMDAVSLRNNLISYYGDLKSSSRKHLTKQYIRGVFNCKSEPFAKEIIKEGVEEFKNAMHGTAADQKKVNNIINYVSSICRDLIGQSLVAKNRKPPYRYEFELPKTRVRSMSSRTFSGIPVSEPKTFEEQFWERFPTADELVAFVKWSDMPFGVEDVGRAIIMHMRGE